MSVGRSGPEPNCLAARFSLRRCLSVFCGFCFCCFFGLSELLLKCDLRAVGSIQRLLAATKAGSEVESCSPRLLRLARSGALEVTGLGPVFWQQGQSNHATSSQPPRWHAEFRASREPAGQLLKGHSRTLAQPSVYCQGAERTRTAVIVIPLICSGSRRRALRSPGLGKKVGIATEGADEERNNNRRVLPETPPSSSGTSVIALVRSFF